MAQNASSPSQNASPEPDDTSPRQSPSPRPHAERRVHRKSSSPAKKAADREAKEKADLGPEVAEEERNKHQAKYQAIQQLLGANGISEEDAARTERVAHIEVALDEYCEMKVLKYFPNLRSVCLIQQVLVKIEGLDNCPSLERVFLNENRIEKIEGLQSCPKLKTLQVCSNCITEIGNGLQDLDRLEVLWIAENLLTNLDGLSLAKNLTEVNASRNRLSTVGHAFENNLKVAVINLSDNRICSFKEILGLARLPRLRELAFADPDWGENPLCSLCNYQTYVSFHLPTLRVHDRMRITDEDHQAAEVAFSKKRLFYNMKIKLVQRLAADGLRWARSQDDERISLQTQEMEPIARLLKRIDAATLARKQNSGAAAQSPQGDAAMTISRAGVERELQEWQVELEDGANIFSELTQAVQIEQDYLIHSLEQELQTGGNIRTESGEDDAKWVDNVQELVKSRFAAQDLTRYGISGIHVHRVTRVLNRSLRIRLEEYLDRTDGTLDSEVTQPIQQEYLFYVPDPTQALADIRNVVEEGPTAGVVLTNSVTIVEIPRIERACAADVGRAVARAAQRGYKRKVEKGIEQKQSPAPVVCSGVLLICSAHFGEQQVHSSPTFDISGAANARALFPSPAEIGLGRPSSDGSPPLPSMYRTRNDDPKQKMWMVPQAEFVLPEFLVDFDYVYAAESTQSLMPGRLEKYGPFGAIFRDFSLHGKLGALEPREEEGAELGLSQNERVAPLPVIERINSANVRDLIACLVTEPAAFTGLQVLNLHGRGIRRIEPAVLQDLSQLRILLLSFNYLESVSSLPRLETIEHIDLAFNLIEKVDALRGLPNLQELDFSWNSLLKLEALETLARDVPQLTSLCLFGNPIAKGTSSTRCRTRALARLKCLRRLDGRDVAPSEVLQAQQTDMQHTEIAEGLLQERSFTSMSSKGMGGDIIRRKSRLDAIGRNQISALLQLDGDINQKNWKTCTEAMDLRNLGLTTVCDLQGFRHLRRMLLSNNELTTLQGLPPMTALEELSLEDNSLQSLKGVSVLTNLKRLDAGCNHVGEVLELQKLTKLSQLSLEDNYIDSLDTFSSLHSLMELYLSNNLVEELRSVLMLKPLPKLVILDLSGNGLCSVQDYRLYTVFHLKKLKVLDGSPVTQAEQATADDRFSGRLTMELLEDKLGPVPACYNLRNVDLSGMSLRDLGNLLNDDIFPSLRELSIESNPFSDLTTVGPLTKLLVLRMSRSKIDVERMKAEDDQGGGIGSMPHLQVLEMGNCSITDISAFGQFALSSLRILHLPGNDIGKLEGLSQLDQLRELVLDRNKIKQFEEASFQGLRCLRELRVEDNGLRSLGNLSPLPRLRALYLGQNRVGELTELEKLASLRHVVLVQMQQNPVARKPLYRATLIQHIVTIRVIDGREVTEEEREKSEQLLQTADTSKQAGMGLYVFTEQQNTTNDNAAAGNSIFARFGQQDGQGPLKPQNAEKEKAAEEERRAPASSKKAPTEPRSATVQTLGPPSIVMMGQGLGDGDEQPAGTARGGGMRRAALAVSAVNAMARAAQGSGDGGGEDGRASKAKGDIRGGRPPRN